MKLAKSFISFFGILLFETDVLNGNQGVEICFVVGKFFALPTKKVAEKFAKLYFVL